MEDRFKKFNNIRQIELPRREFSGYDVDIKNSRSRHKGKKKKLHIFRKIFVFLFGIFLLSCFLGLGMVKGILDSTPTLSSFHFGPTAFATKIVDRNGNLMDTLVKEGSNREPVKYKDIPENLVNAFVAIEDERFWEHSGVDIKSIGRAIYGVLKSDTSRGGGSTITQQLVKNSVFDSALNEKGLQKYVRKLQEQYIALQYETQDSMSKKEIKEQIITDYLNVINLGSNTLGVKVAARRYFDKDLKDLTISECAVIASITKNPTKNNPIKYPDNNKKRQQQVLKNMYNLNYITKEEYDEAMNDEVYSRIKNIDIKSENTIQVYTYFTESVIDQLQEDLVKRLGYSKTLALNLLYSGGLRVETTMDPEIQQIVNNEINNETNYKVKKYSIDYRLSVRHKDDSVTNYSQIDVANYHINKLKNKKYDGLFKTKETADQFINSFKDATIKEDDEVIGENLNYVLEPQCSFVLINHNSGEVLALSGGRGEKTVSRSINRATVTKRQPGSTFKVISSFAPALELYNKTLATTYYDGEYAYKEKVFKNWYSTGFLGFQNLRAGIVYSLNIIAVRCLMETVSPEFGIRFAKKLGISSLDEVEDANPAAALGGLTYGVTNLELTNAFATIANEGNYNKPILYTKVYDHYGKVILDNTKNKSTRVMSKENAYLLTSAMADSMVGNRAFSSPTMNVNSTSTRARFSKMSLAGKSGTTTNNVDVWFVGYSPYYTAGIWAGCDENQSLEDKKTNTNNGGTAFHKNIWRRIMQTIHSTLKDPGFEKPAGIIEKKICRKSGLLASPGCECDPRGNATYTEIFIDGTQPKKRCNFHNADGSINMPARFLEIPSDDTLYMKVETEVVPVIDGIEESGSPIIGPVVVPNGPQ